MLNLSSRTDHTSKTDFLLCITLSSLGEDLPREHAFTLTNILFQDESIKLSHHVVCTINPKGIFKVQGSRAFLPWLIASILELICKQSAKWFISPQRKKILLKRFSFSPSIFSKKKLIDKESNIIISLLYSFLFLTVWLLDKSIGCLLYFSW